MWMNMNMILMIYDLWFMIYDYDEYDFLCEENQSPNWFTIVISWII